MSTKVNIDAELLSHLKDYVVGLKMKKSRTADEDATIAFVDSVSSAAEFDLSASSNDEQLALQHIAGIDTSEETDKDYIDRIKNFKGQHEQALVGLAAVNKDKTPKALNIQLSGGQELPYPEKGTFSSDVSNANLTTQDIVAIFEQLPEDRTKGISFINCNFTAEHIKTIAEQLKAGKKLPNLKNLDLSGNTVDANGLIALDDAVTASNRKVVIKIGDKPFAEQVAAVRGATAAKPPAPPTPAPSATVAAAANNEEYIRQVVAAIEAPKPLETVDQVLAANQGKGYTLDKSIQLIDGKKTGPVGFACVYTKISSDDTIEILKKLKTAGASLTYTDEGSSNPSLRAASSGDTPTLKHLKNELGEDVFKAQINVKSANGNAVEILTKANISQDAISVPLDLLIAAGADVTAQSITYAKGKKKPDSAVIQKLEDAHKTQLASTPPAPAAPAPAIEPTPVPATAPAPAPATASTSTETTPPPAPAPEPVTVRPALAKDKPSKKPKTQEPTDLDNRPVLVPKIVRSAADVGVGYNSTGASTDLILQKMRERGIKEDGDQVLSAKELKAALKELGVKTSRGNGFSDKDKQAADKAGFLQDDGHIRISAAALDRVIHEERSPNKSRYAESRSDHNNDHEQSERPPLNKRIGKSIENFFNGDMFRKEKKYSDTNLTPPHVTGGAHVNVRVRD